MGFKDFDQISERRQAERDRKFRKKVTVGAISGGLLLIFVVAAVISLVSDHTNGNTKSPETPSTKQVSHVDRVVKVLCNSTDYRDKCETTLEKGLETNPSLTQPADLLKTAVAAAADEIKKALDQTKTFKFSNPEEKAAFEDCKELIQDAIDELEESVSQIGSGKSSGKLSLNTPDLNNWLSAVMSYQQTCIDGFPEGKTKEKMEKALLAAKQLTSNSLAMISEVTSFLSAFQVPGLSRRLMADKSGSSPSLDADGVPTWVNQDDRRILSGANVVKPTPNVTVAKDGSGDFKTISEALAAIPAVYQGRYSVYVKEGVYDETVMVTKKMVNITMFGDGSRKTIVTGSKNFVDGVRTFQTATFAALGDGFMAKDMAFRNTAGPQKHQAVAIRVQADRSIFLNCRFEGYQDTLYAQTHRQFYRGCVIAGTVDFIFGDAAVVFQNCMIVVRKPLDNQQNIITAQGRIDKHETTGIVLQNCRILADKKLKPVIASIKSYLGRPWKEYSRTIVMESSIPDFIHPDGWLPWEGDFALKTLYYAEYNNKGPGSSIKARVKWPGYKIINKQEAATYTVKAFLQGDWIDSTANQAIPIHLGLYT